MEPNLDDLFFRPKRFTRQQVIVILLLCVLGVVWMLWPSSHPHRTPRPAPTPRPKPVASPLYVTLVPEEEFGWCCVAGRLSAASKAACKGSFFAEEEEGKRLCPAPTAPSGSPRGRGTGA